MKRRGFFQTMIAVVSSLFVRTQGNAAIPSDSISTPGDSDRRYRVFVPGDIVLARKPPHIFYLPTAEDMQGSLTEETDSEGDFELITREEGLAAVAQFNADVLANWDDEAPKYNDWSILVEIGIEPITVRTRYHDEDMSSFLHIYLEADGTGYEDRSFNHSVRLVRPTAEEIARYAIPAA